MREDNQIPSENVADMLARAKVVLDGHFLLTSGLHSPKYLEKFRLLQYPEYTGRLCRMVADYFEGSGVEVVAGPALGGVILAYEVARLMGVRAVYAGEGGRGQRLSSGVECRGRGEDAYCGRYPHYRRVGGGCGQCRQK